MPIVQHPANAAARASRVRRRASGAAGLQVIDLWPAGYRPCTDPLRNVLAGRHIQGGRRKTWLMRVRLQGRGSGDRQPCQALSTPRLLRAARIPSLTPAAPFGSTEYPRPPVLSPPTESRPLRFVRSLLRTIWRRQPAPLPARSKGRSQAAGRDRRDSPLWSDSA